jgi:hypothetical protein
MPRLIQLWKRVCLRITFECRGLTVDYREGTVVDGRGGPNSGGGNERELWAEGEGEGGGGVVRILLWQRIAWRLALEPVQYNALCSGLVLPVIWGATVLSLACVVFQCDPFRGIDVNYLPCTLYLPRRIYRERYLGSDCEM